MSVNTPINSDPLRLKNGDGASKFEAPSARPIRWRRWLVAIALLAVLDAAQPPKRQPSAFLALATIDLYQASLSKLMPNLGISCRFTPTCSHYGEGAIRARGTWAGIGLILRRLVRCGPWTPLGTEDPPPERAEPIS